jgi:hypothetical protein
LLEAVLADSGWLVRAAGTERYVVYRLRFCS